MMRKAHLLFCLVFVLLCSQLFAAGGQQTGSQPGDIRQKMLICWNGGFKVPVDQYNNPVAKAIRDKIGVTIEFEGIMMSETERLNLMFASGDMPDIVNGPFWGGNAGETAVIKKGAAEGRLHPIQDMLEKYPNVKRSYDIGVISQNYLDRDLRDASFNGNLYVIPQETGGTPANISNWAYGVFVRGDVPKALGVDPSTIKTSQQLYEFMVKARDYGFRDVNGNPTIVGTTFHNGWNIHGYSEAYATQKKVTSFIKNPDGTVTYDWLTPNYVERQMFIWRLVNEGLIDRECFRHTGDQANTKVGNGTALFYAAQYTSGITPTKDTGLYQSHPEMRYVPIGPMTYQDGSTFAQVETMGRSGSPVIFFPTTNKNLDASFRYIDYINTVEGMTLAAYGIEGQTYTRNAQGQPRLVADLLRRKAAGDSTWEDQLRETGAHFIWRRLWYGSQRVEWFGEREVGEADAAVPEVEAYKLQRPLVRLPGYPISAFQSEFPEWSRVAELAFTGDPERTWRERAYFAPTAAEARQILLDWQNHLRTQQNGVFMQWLNFLSQRATTRNDIIF